MSEQISTVELIKKETDKGYIRVLYNNNWIYEHVLVVEKFIGRELYDGEVVHHIDHNKKNNIIDNLMLFSSQKEHKHFENKITQFGLTRPILKTIKERWNFINTSK